MVTGEARLLGKAAPSLRQTWDMKPPIIHPRPPTMAYMAAPRHPNVLMTSLTGGTVQRAKQYSTPPCTGEEQGWLCQRAERPSIVKNMCTACTACHTTPGTNAPTQQGTAQHMRVAQVDNDVLFLVTSSNTRGEPGTPRPCLYKPCCSKLATHTSGTSKASQAGMEVT